MGKEALNGLADGFTFKGNESSFSSQADGTIELMKGIDAGVPDLVTYSDDFEKIVGHKAMSIQEWTKAVAPGFAGSSETNLPA